MLIFVSNLYSGNSYFNTLVNSAYKNNYIIKLYQNTLNALKENINIAEGNFVLKINFLYTFTGTTEPGSAAFFISKQGKFSMSYYFNHMTNPPFVKDHQVMVSLIQPIFSKGKIYLSREQARLNYNAGLHSLNEIKREIQFKIFNVLINANRLLENIKIAENLRKRAEIYLTTIETAYNNGTALKSDYYFARFHFKEADIKLKSLRNELNKIKFALKQLTGKEFKVKKTEFSIPGSFNINKLIGYGVEKRDDIVAFKDYVKIAEIEVKKRKNEYLPEMFGFANYERNSEKLTDFDKDGYSVGIGLKLNVFNGMIDKNRINQAKYNLMKMKNMLFNRKASLKREVKDAYVDFENSKFIYETMQQLVNTNETALKISETRFKQGLERITTLVDMETNYKTSLYKLSDAKWDKVLKYYTILFKAGKF